MTLIWQHATFHTQEKKTRMLNVYTFADEAYEVKLSEHIHSIVRLGKHLVSDFGAPHHCIRGSPHLKV